MIIKTVRAATMTEAVARIKATMSDSALIIDSRKVRPHGTFGFLRRPLVEVVVGIEGETPEARGDEGRAAGDGAEPQTPPDGEAQQWAADAAKLRSLEGELTGIHDTLRLVTDAAPFDLPAPFQGLHRRLTEQGVDGPTATALVEECRTELTNAGGGLPLNHLRAALRRRFRTGEEAPPRAGAGPRALALVGPPGVGKTTTLAKLAGRFALERRESVALVSLDFFRVGAVEQLKAYAEILDAPFQHIAAPEEVPRAVAAAGSAAWLLVDTPGLPHYDTERLGQLGRWLETFPGVERHLLIGATTELQAALAAIEGYRNVGFGCLGFTKLDETRRPGLLLAAAEAAGVPVSYLSAGQDAARDLDYARAGRLADLVLGATRSGRVQRP